MEAKLGHSCICRIVSVDALAITQSYLLGKEGEDQSHNEEGAFHSYMDVSRGPSHLNEIEKCQSNIVRVRSKKILSTACHFLENRP